MALPKILIVIVTWNKERDVLNLLGSLNDLDYPHQCMEKIVVDNASTDNTVASIRECYPDVTLICNGENLGGTGGFNTGLQWAFDRPDGQFDYIWLLDNDVLVNRYALTELVELLEKNPDAAVAGSTMMQQDYPWRINEVGSFYNRHTGALILNLHMVEIHPWRGRDVSDLLMQRCDLSQFIPDYHPYLDVDYVAAASLLIRADVAKKVGLWQDFFIHFDDVEWCLRISQMGHRVLCSCRSLIWHLSSVVKVPTWVLYYDSRNMLSVLAQYARHQKDVARALRREHYKAIYYALVGRGELAALILDGVNDFKLKRLGKREISLPALRRQHDGDFTELPFMDPEIKRILISWHVNLLATKLQEPLVRVLKARPDLTVDCMTLPGGDAVYQLPNTTMISLSKNRMLRMIQYWRLRGTYDLVIQSDYQKGLFLSWLKAKLMFVNNENYCLRPASTLFGVMKFLFDSIFKRLR